MYGEKVGDREVIGDSIVEFKRLSDKVVEARVCTPYECYEKNIILERGDELRLYPLPPINTPEQITSYILYKLENPIVVPSGSRVSVTITTLIEVGVGVYSRSEKRVRDYVDFIPPYRMKYCLYGKPNDGVIARLCPTKVQFIDVLEAEQEPFKALTRLNIVNSAGTSVMVSRVLVDAEHMTMYFDEQDRLFTSEVTLNIVSENEGYTVIEKKPLLPGLMSSPTHARGRIRFLDGIPYELKKTIMKHGFNKIVFIRS